MGQAARLGCELYRLQAWLRLRAAAFLGPYPACSPSHGASGPTTSDPKHPVGQAQTQPAQLSSPPISTSLVILKDQQEGAQPHAHWQEPEPDKDLG